MRYIGLKVLLVEVTMPLKSISHTYGLTRGGIFGVANPGQIQRQGMIDRFVFPSSRLLSYIDSLAARPLQERVLC